MILLVTSTDDDEAGQVIRKLRQLNARFFRLNCDRLHDLYNLSVNLTTPSFTLRHKRTGQEVHHHEVSAVWWTHVALPGEEHQAFPDYLSEFLDDEYYCAAISLLAVLEARHVPVVNHPVRHNIAGHKSFQQRTALTCGFKIPDHLITNEGAAFLKQPWADSAVFKPVSNSRYVDRGDEKIFVTVRAIDEPLREQIADKTLPLDIHLFQARIPIQKEYRVTVFGDKVFAFRIDGSYDFDWRTRLSAIDYVREPRFPWAQACRDYMRHTGIRMGCFDLILSQTGDMYFIECNAPGYFLFCDPRGRYKLATTFARYLKSLRPESK
jgi:glutathione synthase/RimK-type ligase-like ATP-grasp enzyme